METNALPHYDSSLNPTGCCPKFNPEGWDGRELHFDNKRFVRATTWAFLHIPLNMGSVFKRVLGNMEAAGATDDDNTLVLSRDLSPWRTEHLFAVTKPVMGEGMTFLSGDFVTRVFEGPYRKVKGWHLDMEELVRARGGEPGAVYFFFTTCPKCAKVYGENHVVGVAQI